MTDLPPTSQPSTSQPSTSQLLRELQRQEVRMLKLLHRVAEETGLRYYLAYGTALGAARDGEPIPWDWDADVHIPIEEYEGMLHALSVALPPDLKVSRVGDEGYEAMFARIHSTHVDHACMHVDLFALSGAPRSRRGQKLHYVANRLLCRMHGVKRLRFVDRPHYSRRLISVLALVKLLLAPIPARVIRAAHRRLNRRPTTSAEWLCNPAGTYDGLREYFPVEYFADGQAVRTGTLSGLVLPRRSSDYLTGIYGRNFRTPIPEEKQLEAVRFFERYVAPGLSLTDSGS